ncbi:MAG: four helix bundle protein [Planctomycetaceae bacterium]|nr:four helix bundle protein [Planctomycetaceae bacterium]
MSVESYRDLKVWQKAIDLTVDCYAITKAYPSDEKYGLTSQTRRAAGSVAANIAEGHGRGTPKSFLNHLWIANGSLKELETHLIVSGRLEYVSREDARPLFALCEEIGRMLVGLRHSLQQSD